MKTKTRRTWVFTLTMILAWTVAGWIAAEVARPDPGQFGGLGPGGQEPTRSFAADMLRSLVGGTASGLVAAFLELKVMPRYSSRVGAGLLLVGRTLAYGAVAIIAVATTVRYMARAEFGIAPRELVASDGFQEFLRSSNFVALIAALLVASFVINGILQVARLLGPATLTHILLGRYLRPVHEDRSFLFVDLVDSTGIAERLGPLRFAAFKNDFFHDVAEPVLNSRGQIAQYVGDEVLITWPVRRRGTPSSADGVRCCFDLRERIQSRAPEYQQKYGLVPDFRAGLHCGPVVVAQLGDIKRELTFSGDAVNAASRIQGLCKQLGRDFLASKDVIRGVTLPGHVRQTDLGVHSLRGREATVELVALHSERA